MRLDADRNAGVVDRYSGGAMLLHWIIAGLIAYNLLLGFFMEKFPLPLRMIIVPMHISAGVSILVLSVIRVGWRVFHPAPAPPTGTPVWQRRLADSTHILLYIMLVAMPLTGWASTSTHPPKGSAGAAYAADLRMKKAAASGHKMPSRTPADGLFVWGAIPLPFIIPLEDLGRDAANVPAQRRLHNQLVDLHATGAFVMIALLLAHIAGALKHGLSRRSPTLSRMLPG